MGSLPTENGAPDGSLVTITLTPEELKTQKLSSQTLQEALEALHDDGVVAITNAIDPDALSTLNEVMVPEATKIYEAADTQRNLGSSTGNIQQDPPIEPHLLFPSIIANPFVASICSHALGPNPRFCFYSSNVAFKGKEPQPTHVDIGFPRPSMPFGYLVNTYTVDVSPENGSTELWPATQRITKTKNLNYVISRDQLEEQRKIRPPVQPSLPKGGVIIRDFKLWHGGIPNPREDDPRVMLGMAYLADWWRCDMTTPWPKELDVEKIDWHGIKPAVRLVSKEERQHKENVRPGLDFKQNY